MTTLQKYIAAGVVVILVLLGWFSFSGNKYGAFQQGQVQTDAFLFVNGFAAGTSQQFLVDSTGALTTSGVLTSTGKLVASSIINTFGSTASSTVQVGGASKAGCLILGDSADGASVVYITATGSTLTASTTKPAACQTAI